MTKFGESYNGSRRKKSDSGKSRSMRLNLLLTLEILEPKCRRTQSFLTGFLVRGDALKGCSAGGWRSGRRRSEGWWRRGHFQPLHWVFRACRYSLEHLVCHAKSFFGNEGALALGRGDHSMISSGSAQLIQCGPSKVTRFNRKDQMEIN